MGSQGDTTRHLPLLVQPTLELLISTPSKTTLSHVETSQEPTNRAKLSSTLSQPQDFEFSTSSWDATASSNTTATHNFNTDTKQHSLLPAKDITSPLQAALTVSSAVHPPKTKLSTKTSKYRDSQKSRIQKYVKILLEGNSGALVPLLSLFQASPCLHLNIFFLHCSSSGVYSRVVQ